METKLQLLRNEAAEVVVRDITPIEMVLIVSGVVFWVLVAFALVRWAVLRSEWLTDPDIHPSVLCICRDGRVNVKCPLRYADSHRTWNRTNTLSIPEMRSVPTDPKRGA